MNFLSSLGECGSGEVNEKELLVGDPAASALIKKFPERGKIEIESKINNVTLVLDNL